MARRIRVFVDGQHLEPSPKGVGLYAANVLQHLVRRDDLELHVLLRQGVPFSLPSEIVVHRAGWGNRFRWGLFQVPRSSASLAADVVWLPGETCLGQTRAPVVVVVHDLTELIRAAQVAGGQASNRKRRIIEGFDSWLIGRSLRRSSTVACNSRFIADAVRRLFRVPGERLAIAPCAPGADFAELADGSDRPATRRRLGFERYVLAIATGDPRENAAILPAVFERLAADWPDLGFVVAGVRDGNRSDLESSLGAVLNEGRFRLEPFFSADRLDELAALYAAAAVYLDPTLHEGFGMQVVEAMACGTPVVCSNAGALPEVVGQAALLVDPRDAEALAGAAGRLLDDPDLAAVFTSRGRSRAAGFDWERTEKEIYAAIRRAADR